MYTEYVTKKYGKAVFVFDGYSGTSTKDMTHQRRTEGRKGVTVTFTEDMHFTMKKMHFLANTSNKQRFIIMLGNQLKQQGCTVYHAPGDADLLIVQKAIESAIVGNTVLVGDDTDLLVLLCYHVSLTLSTFFSDQSQKRVLKTLECGTSKPSKSI